MNLRQLCAYLTLLVLPFNTSGCSEQVIGQLSRPLSTDGLPRFWNTPQHLGVSLVPSWDMRQDFALGVAIPPLGEPLILAVELIPRLSEKLVEQRPSTVDATPVAGHLEEVKGYLLLYRVAPGIHDIALTYPAPLFAPLLDNAQDLSGWELKVILTSRIDAYPVRNGAIGKRYPITVDNVPSRQTWIISLADSEIPADIVADFLLVIPDSTSGAFLYYPLDAIADSIVLPLTQPSDPNDRGGSP